MTVDRVKAHRELGLADKGSLSLGASFPRGKGVRKTLGEPGDSISGNPGEASVFGAPSEPWMIGLIPFTKRTLWSLHLATGDDPGIVW